VVRVFFGPPRRTPPPAGNSTSAGTSATATPLLKPIGI